MQYKLRPIIGRF